jgi:hypothetical protein
MNTSLIRKIIASDLPRKEQDLLILLVTDYDSVNQKKVAALDSYYRENEPEYSEGECESDLDEDLEEEEYEDSEEEKDSKGTVKYEDCDDRGFNKAVRAQYEERHGRILSGSELAAETAAQNSIKYDHSKAWGLQFPSHTIWGNWVHSYDK